MARRPSGWSLGLAGWLFADLALVLAFVSLDTSASGVTAPPPDAPTTTTIPKDKAPWFSCAPIEFRVKANISPERLEREVTSRVSRLAATNNWSDARPALIDLSGINRDRNKGYQLAERFTLTIRKTPSVRSTVVIPGGRSIRNIKDEVKLAIFVTYYGSIETSGCLG